MARHRRLEIPGAVEEEMLNKVKYSKAGLNLEKLIDKVCKMTSIEKEDLRKKGRGNNISKAKGLISVP